MFLLWLGRMFRELSAVMERESIRDQVARRLPDHDEAIEAFTQKREPEFNK